MTTGGGVRSNRPANTNKLRDKTRIEIRNETHPFCSRTVTGETVY